MPGRQPWKESSDCDGGLEATGHKISLSFLDFKLLKMLLK